MVIGVTGGIAAYKALDIVSGLRKKEIDVNVIMTQHACEFVNPLSFQSLSNNYVTTDMFAEPKSWDVEHISLAKKASLILVAPATANIIGKVAHGIADDMLSTVIMAARCPIVFAPAMNTYMYTNSIVQENIHYLKSKGYHFIEPDSGWLACGDIGKGKLPTPETIIQVTLDLLEKTQVQKQDFQGKNVLVTAGPTVEEIDPMRYITNHSSGKMGYAIAQEAAKRGANVKLISGPTHLPCPAHVERIDIKSALDMEEEAKKHFSWSDVVIKAAAVADYRPAQRSQQKIKKSEDNLTIQLTRNPDILQELGKQKEHQILVGFAAETEELLKNAKEKLQKKNLDFIIANNIAKEGSGFQVDTNRATFIYKDGTINKHPMMSKTELANVILDEVKNKF